MSSDNKAPMPTLERLTTYHTVLSDLKRANVETVSSLDIEELTGVNAAQFRKDLSHFGEFGRPGIGYNVNDLHSRIIGILKLDRKIPILLVGAGNLGSALVGYPALRSQNFQIAAVFDNSSSKVGKKLWGLTIENIESIGEVNRRIGARIGIIAVPAQAAQEVVEKLVAAEVKSILNFAPAVLKPIDGVTVRHVDFVQELAVLSYQLPES